MGTLTANSDRLPGYCDHKLPTSCRLSSIPECCACADERGHSAAYSVYIDGVGYVARGTRWQRYCWFCKEFWQKRVDVSGLRPAQTRIPERPNQTAFLERWYEFHRGYRVVKKEDGSEERVAVLGEPWMEVSPGYLPRTLEELRAGAARNALEASVQERDAIQVEEEGPTGPSLEDALDQMLEDAVDEEQERHRAPQISNGVQGEHDTSNIHGQAMVPLSSRNHAYQARRVAALRRELHRMRNGIERVVSGLRELGEYVPDETEATAHLTELGQTLDTISGIPSQEDAERAINSVNSLTQSAGTAQSGVAHSAIQTRLDEAYQHREEARRARDQASSELEMAQQEYRTSQERHTQIQREHRSMENYTRLFGTREEMAAQGDDYVSPIGDMFSRAYERFRTAEQVRREERTLRQVLQNESASNQFAGRHPAEIAQRSREFWSVPTLTREHFAGPLFPEDNEPNIAEPQGDEVALEEYYALLRRQNQDQEAPQDQQTPRETESTQPATTNNSNRNDFPRNMLDAVMANRLRRAAEPRPRRPRLAPLIESPPLEESSRVYGLLSGNDDYQALRTEDLVILLKDKNRTYGDESEENDFILIAMASDSTVREHSIWEQEQVRRMLISRLSTSENDALAVPVERLGLNQNQDLVWASGLPARRLAYLRSVGFQDVITRDTTMDEEIQGVFDFSNQLEYAAEAYQMSSEFRRRSGLDPPSQLRMLYRLQAGHRNREDRQVLFRLVDPDSTAVAERIHATATDIESPADEARRHQLNEERRQDARDREQSRLELDSQRRATHAFAAAAGRLAMQTGPAALLERMANRDPETRAAYTRLQQNWLATTDNDSLALDEYIDPARAMQIANQNQESPSSSEAEPEDLGLDDPTTDRPTEPLSEEAMTVSMECRICYTQLAEIACLPCGHLVMCRWCSEQHSPAHPADRTRPRRAAGCPVCRKGIKQKVRVYRN